jgi:hypothetical protein
MDPNLNPNGMVWYGMYDAPRLGGTLVSNCTLYSLFAPPSPPRSQPPPERERIYPLEVCFRCLRRRFNTDSQYLPPEVQELLTADCL